MQFSVALRNARQAQIEMVAGPSPIMRIRTGPSPANCAAPDTGAVLATLPLSADWLGSPANGAVSKSGTWQDISADAGGTPGHFRVYDSSGTVCHVQGKVGPAGSIAYDLVVSSETVAVGSPFAVTEFTVTDGNA